MTLHRRRRKVLAQWPTLLWLALVWMLLWGDFSWANLFGGLAVAFLVTLLFPLPALGIRLKFRPLQFMKLGLFFFFDLAVASAQVSWQALNFTKVPHGAVVGVKLRNPADLYLTITAELSTLVPGSLVVEAHRLTGMLYLHVLDLDTYGGREKVRSDVLALEERVLRALASDEDLVLAGLDPRSRRKRNRELQVDLEHATRHSADSSILEAGAAPEADPEENR